MNKVNKNLKWDPNWQKNKNKENKTKKTKVAACMPSRAI